MLSLTERRGIYKSQKDIGNNTNRIRRKGVGIVERWRYFLHICYWMLIVYIQFSGTGKKESVFMGGWYDINKYIER